MGERESGRRPFWYARHQGAVLGPYPSSGVRRFLLSSVVHLQDRNLRQVVDREPRVGVYCGPGRLIWITPEAVLLEETLTLPGERPGYASTGFSYRERDDTLEADEAFQVLYTRHPDDRPGRHRFPLDLRVGL